MVRLALEVIEMHKKDDQKIACTVYDCKHCDCDHDSCKLKEIKVCCCDSEHEKEATMCDSYKKRK